MKSSNRLTAVLGALVLSHLFLCIPLSTDLVEEEATVLRLSLEESGRTVAEFSGAPIEAIVDLDRDTTFNALYWQTGRGDPPQFSGSPFGKTGKRFSVLLSWTKYPLVKNSDDSCYWDTVWVNIGGGLKKSNKVRIKVTNLPVVFDSIRFDSTVFQGQDTMWQCILPEVLKKSYPLQLFVRDLDRKTVALQISGNRGKIIRGDLSSLNMVYEPLRSDFVDTIIFVATDQARGKAVRTLVVKYRMPNIFPSIDSIQAGSSMLGATSFFAGMYRVGIVAFDTVRMHVFARDSGGSIKSVRWSSRSNKLTVDTANPLNAAYSCSGSGCRDSIRDSSVIVDTIRVVVVDDRNDSVARYIQLIHGTINQPPALALLSIDGKELSLAGVPISATVSGGVSHTLRLKASDPEKKTVTATWTGYPSSRFSDKSDSMIMYGAPAVRDTDTVRVTLSDASLTTDYTVRFIVDDVVPSFDSLLVGDTVFRGSDAACSLLVAPRDTLLMIAYIRDRDAVDSMSCSWSAGKPARFATRIGNRAKYLLPDSLLNDTIILKIQDGAYVLSRKIYLQPVNMAPIVDSCRSGNRRLNQSGIFFRDSAMVGDTAGFRIFARDPEKDVLSYVWNAADSTSFNSRTMSETAYFCSKASIDTLSITITDPQGAVALRRIILKVTTAVKP